MKPYDHRHLNFDAPEFRDLNPTSENLTRVIWDKLARRLSTAALGDARLYKVAVRETARNYFEYYGDRRETDELAQLSDKERYQLEHLDVRPPREAGHGDAPIVRPDQALIEAHYGDILKFVGEDPEREGLLRTPHRVAEALKYMTSGYTQDVDTLLNGAIFTEDYDDMVVVKDIEFYSLCEHHLLPFFGKVHVAYIPNGRIVACPKSRAWWICTPVACRCRSV